MITMCGELRDVLEYIVLMLGQRRRVLSYSIFLHRERLEKFGYVVLVNAEAQDEGGDGIFLDGSLYDCPENVVLMDIEGGGDEVHDAIFLNRGLRHNFRDVVLLD